MIKYLVVLNLRILCKDNIQPVRCLFKFKPCFVMFTSDLNFFFKFSFNLLPNNVNVNLVCFSPKLVFQRIILCDVTQNQVEINIRDWSIFDCFWKKPAYCKVLCFNDLSCFLVLRDFRIKRFAPDRKCCWYGANKAARPARGGHSEKLSDRLMTKWQEWHQS